MKRFLLTLALGTLFATLGEYLFCVLVRQSLADYLFTLVAYPVILAMAWTPMRWIDRHLSTRLAADVGTYLFAGLTGLAVEWFVIGNSPWENPEAHDLGMFCFWTTVLVTPRLMLDPRPILRPVRRAAAVAFAAFSASALAIGFLTPQPLRLFVLVWAVVFGYSGMNWFFLRAFYLEWKAGRGALVSYPLEDAA